MKFENTLLNFLKKKYGNKISAQSNLFIDLKLDSFDLVKLVAEIEGKFKKKYNPNIIIDFDNLDIKKFSKFFK